MLAPSAARSDEGAQQEARPRRSVLIVAFLAVALVAVVIMALVLDAPEIDQEEDSDAKKKKKEGFAILDTPAIDSAEAIDRLNGAMGSGTVKALGVWDSNTGGVETSWYSLAPKGCSDELVVFLPGTGQNGSDSLLFALPIIEAQEFYLLFVSQNSRSFLELVASEAANKASSREPGSGNPTYYSTAMRLYQVFGESFYPQECLVNGAIVSKGKDPSSSPLCNAFEDVQGPSVIDIMEALAEKSPEVAAKYITPGSAANDGDPQSRFVWSKISLVGFDRGGTNALLANCFVSPARVIASAAPCYGMSSGTTDYFAQLPPPIPFLGQIPVLRQIADLDNVLAWQLTDDSVCPILRADTGNADGTFTNWALIQGDTAEVKQSLTQKVAGTLPSKLLIGAGLVIRGGLEDALEELCAFRCSHFASASTVVQKTVRYYGNSNGPNAVFDTLPVLGSEFLLSALRDTKKISFLYR